MKQADLAHPHRDQLTAFGSGQLDRATLDEVAHHVAGCDLCRQELEDLPEDTLVSLLRGATVVPTPPGQKGPIPPPSADATALPAAPVRGDVTAAFLPADSSTSAAASSAALPSEPLALPPPLLQHPRYHVLDLLGTGGMGAVYRARHRMMDRPVALKVISGRLVNRPDMVERFHREVKAAAQLSHPNIVTAHDAEQAGDTHFLVMELVDGQSLDRLVQERGPLPVAEACEYVRQAALGLQHAFERGMVHRDIKPQNLMRTPDGRVKILDFGLAHFVSEALPPAALTEVGTVMGTPDYIAPEQARDSHSADTRADIYSLGCTLYFLLTGQPPFPEGTYVQKLAAHLERMPRRLDELRGGLPPGLSRVVERMLTKDPAQRYQRPAEVAAALAPFAAPSAARRPPRRLPMGWAAAALLVGLLGAGGYWAAPTLYRIATSRGELVIETDDPDVEVIVRKGGEDVRIVDPAGGSEITLKAGTYQMELRKGAEKGLRLSTDHFTLERGGKVIVRVQVKSPAGTPESATAQQGVQLRQRAQLKEEELLTGEVFSPGGKLLAVGREDGKVGLWDVAAGKRETLLQVSSLPVRGLAFSPDGKTLATGAGDWKQAHLGGEVKLWDVASGKEVKALKGHRGPIYAVAFSPDGRTLASAGLEGAVRLWDVGTGKVRAVLDADTSYGLAFAPDGQAVAAACVDHTAKVWDVRTGKLKRTLEGHSEELQSVAFSPDGKTIATGSRDQTARLWEASTFRLRAVLRHNNWVASLSFSPNGKILAVGDSGSFAKLWDVAGGKEVTDVPRPGVQSGAWVAFSLDGDLLATGNYHKTVKLWDVAPAQGTGPGKAVGQVRGREGAPVVIPPEPLPERKPGSPLSAYTLVSQPAPIKGVRSWTVETVGARANTQALSHVPGSSLLACASSDGQIRLWDLRRNRLVRVLVGGTKGLPSLACSPDGRALACGDWEGLVQVWDIGSGRLLRTLRRQETGAARSLAWSPDGRTLAVGCDDNSVWLWDPASAAVRDRLRGHGGAVWSVVWSPDGKVLASGSADKTVRVWDVRSGEAQQTLQRHSAPVRAVAFSPDGKTLASGSEDGTVRLWEASSGTLQHTMEDANAFMRAVAWSPDGTTLAMAGSNLRLWDPRSGKQRMLKGHYHIVDCVSWALDGKTLASGSWDNRVRIWDAVSGQPLGSLWEQNPPFNHTLAWSPDARLLAVGSRVTPLTLYEGRSGRVVRTLPGVAGDALTWSPDGKTLATTPWGEKEVRLWEVSSGKLLQRLQGHDGDVYSLAWSPDGKTLASGSMDGTVRLWLTESGELLRTLKVQAAEDGGVHALAWSPDGKILASGGKEVRLWEAASGKALQSQGGQPQTLLALAWSPDGKTLAVGSGDDRTHWAGQLRLWSPGTGRQRLLQRDSGAIHALVWTPEGKTLFSGGGWGSLCMWEASSGRLIRELPGHVAPLHGLSLSADGALASAEDIITIRVWDGADGKEKGVLVPLPGEGFLAVSADGHYSASSGVEDQIVYVVETEQGQETLSPAEFARRFDWKNDPRRVRLTGK